MDVNLRQNDPRVGFLHDEGIRVGLVFRFRDRIEQKEKERERERERDVDKGFL